MFIVKSLHNRDSDLEVPSTRPVSLSSGRIRAVSVILVFLLGFFAFPNAVGADFAAFHEQSRSYDVHLGIVPAAQTAADAQLDRFHKMSGQHVEKFGDNTMHLLVAVFRKSDGGRVENADVFAEVVENDLLRVKRTRRTLNLRPLDGGTTYCNFFDLNRPGEYIVHVQVREEGLGTEMVTFVITKN